MNSNNRCFHIVLWNVRGLGDSDKCNIVRNVFIDAKPSIICIQESKLAAIDLFKAKSFLPPPFSSAFVYAPAGRSRGGIVTAWDPSLFTLLSHFQKPHTLTTKFACNASDLDFTITNTYGPSDHATSLPFLQCLRELPPLIGGSWILLGDFNLVCCAADKNNGQFSAPLAATFNETLHDLSVSEVTCNGST
jgi:exonuclease III